MNRRKFIKATVGSGIAIGFVGSAVWFSIDEYTKPLTIDAGLNLIKSISSQSISHVGEWNPTQIFNHCAQSVEYSMIGFPEHKSDLFKNTVGQLAFSAFSAKGKMTHGLNEVIPGAPELTADNNIALALSRLKKSMLAFKHYDGELAPHFAYGELSKDEYEAAHVMHLLNHLNEIKVSSA
ncbi:MAG: DUF1569 domain-containing protein [Marinicellaceae bacterium]